MRQDCCDLLGQRADLVAGRLALHKVIAFVRKIEGGLETRRQIKEALLELGNPDGQRALKLIERRPRLERRDRLDQVSDCRSKTRAA